MRIDKEKIKTFAALDDKALWEEIKKVGTAHGFKLPENPPAKGELDKVRGALFQTDKINLGEALRVIDKYRKGV